LLLQARRPAEAAAEFRRAFEVDPNNPQAGVELARVLVAQGHTAEAARVLEEFLARNPGSPGAYPLLADLRDRQGDHAGAVRAAREGLALEPTSASLHVFLARGLVREGAAAEGVEHYRIALRFDPNSLPALIGLAWVLAAHEDDRVRDGAEAVRLAERAVERTGGRGIEAVRVLAAALAEAGDFRKAAEIAGQLVAAIPLAGIPKEQAERLKQELESYRAGRPLREKPATIPDR
jgi:predicted Zn-dependent protease